ncbi:MAG: ASCH domain-containing protein [Acutalibacteraceae bacterium]|nr:ASCH domain-containing protein [Acutalibacteraceae bacterium]
MIHNMKLYQRPFDKIANGSKKIELRINDEKRQKINVGDIIEFHNYNDESNVIKVMVKALHKYPDFYQLYKQFDKVAMGYNENEIANPDDMEEYYSKENIKKYGALGIEIELV